MNAAKVLEDLKDGSPTNQSIIKQWKKYFLQLKKSTTNTRNLTKSI